MFNIQNEWLEVAIKPKGAELDSLYSKKEKLEYMWSADPAFWSKKSPVLFPIVGSLKNNGYYFKGNFYEMGRHGFARDSEFAVVEQTPSSIRFSLAASQQTLSRYPFRFRFDVRYALSGSMLETTYSVENPGGEEIYFSVGGHPAFKVPLVPGLSYNDYYLQFDKPETAGRWPISKDGLIESAPVPLMKGESRLPLTKDLFYNDALVLKQLSSKKVTLQSEKDRHGLHFYFEGFPFLGIWAAPGADFVCIEPWCGIADSVNGNQQIKEKEGIVALSAGGVFSRSWKVEVF